MTDTNYFFLRNSEGEITKEHMPLLFLVPLVQMAWAHGAISPREKHVIFEAAREDEIDHRSSLNDTLDKWLVYQPSRQFYDDALGAIKDTLQTMTVKDRNQKRGKIFERCRTVAAAAGGKSLMDLNHHVSAEEKALLVELEQTLS